MLNDVESKANLQKDNGIVYLDIKIYSKLTMYGPIFTRSQLAPILLHTKMSTHMLESKMSGCQSRLMLH